MYTVESYKNPFWAENSGFMTGRDPLGIQNSSITTYARLLPGMTNLTLRLRYYGFYMWLIREFYKKNEGRTNFTHREHYNFIRRGELIISYIMQVKASHEKSIIGSDFTGRQILEINEKGYYDIHLGADKLKNTVKGSVYWDFRSGALGQYYAGALSALKLINTEGQFFQMEERGESLAEAFSESIDINLQKKFIEVIENGRLYYADIEALDGFRINQITPNSKEWQIYLEILQSNDADGFQDAKGVPTHMRKDSIRLLLDYYNQEFIDLDDRGFILHQFNLNHKSPGTGASFGWYYYYLNEAFHIALESIFWAVLVELDGRPKEVEGFIDDLLKPVLIIAEKELHINKNDNFFEVISHLEINEISKQLNELLKLYKKSDNSKIVMLRSLELMMLIYRGINNVNEQIVDFEKQYKIILQKGRITENIRIYIKNSLSYSFEFFAKNAIKKIMNDHVNTAYRKMGNGESNLLKFIVEDGIISHIQTMEPRQTSPRLRTIINFLNDLSLIDENKKLTTKGNWLRDKLSM